MATLGVFAENACSRLHFLGALWLSRRCSALTQDQVDSNLSAKCYRFHKNNVLRQNRRDPNLEEQARLKKLYVDLSAVRREWLGERGRGLQQLKTSGVHCHIFQDLFGCEFWPRGILDVCYSNCYPVTWGDVIPAKLALSEPKVTLPSHMTGAYATLLLTNPDGHLQDPSRELLHWMVADIPLREGAGDVAEGSTLLQYLPPVPPQGTGFHRYVFSLYTHANPLATDSTHLGVANEGWLQQRLFSSNQFLTSGAEVEIKPWTFCFFQSQWDKSVSHTYKHVLSFPEPVYGPERRYSRRTLRRREIFAVRQAKYTSL